MTTLILTPLVGTYIQYTSFTDLLFSCGAIPSHCTHFLVVMDLTPVIILDYAANLI